MDHPELAVDDPTGRSLYDTDRDIVLGHEFVGEVIGHGPGCTSQFEVGSRVTAMPIRLLNVAQPVCGSSVSIPKHKAVSVSSSWFRKWRLSQSRVTSPSMPSR
jgi:hypothetical protein